MRTEFIQKMEYVKLCAERAILQEKGEMEQLGNWYFEQQFSDIERALAKAKAIHREGRQIQLFPTDKL